MTAAHKTLPFGTVVRVVDQRTGKSVNVTINDRGPFHKGRIIDLSKAAASRLGIRNAGTGKVCITRVCGRRVTIQGRPAAAGGLFPVPSTKAGG